VPDHVERFPSARDIEKVARNPECKTLTTALAANVDLRKYAVELGLQEERQSPLALAKGNQVERFVLRDGAAKLVERLTEDGKLHPEPWVEDLGKRAPNRAGMEKVATRTDGFIADLLAGKSVPDILVHPVLRIALGPDIQFIEPDALIRYSDADGYEPMELKSYPYRFGKTDGEDLRQARRQGAVYVYALRRRVEALGGNPVGTAAQVTLVFTRPDSLFPAPIYHESVRGEMRDAENAIALLEDAKAELKLLIPPGSDVRTLLPTLDIHYMEKCLSFCSLAKRCRESCSEEGKVSVLGENTARILAPAGTIERAVELLEGSPPKDDGEAALAQRLRAIASSTGSLRGVR
jgi:hypothetical protein